MFWYFFKNIFELYESFLSKLVKINFFKKYFEKNKKKNRIKIKNYTKHYYNLFKFHDQLDFPNSLCLFYMFSQTIFGQWSHGIGIKIDNLFSSTSKALNSKCIKSNDDSLHYSAQSKYSEDKKKKKESIKHFNAHINVTPCKL